jgi:hypothetical protein
MQIDSQQMLRLRDLTSRLCDSEITDEETVELAGLLEGNETATVEYLAYTSLHLDLSQRLRKHRESDARLRRAPHVVLPDHSGARHAQPIGRKVHRLVPWAALLAIATSLLIAAVFLTRSAAPRAEYTARIVKMIDCDWGSTPWEKSQAVVLSAGQQLRLNRGMMILEFAQGAEVMLEAPVDFRVVDTNHCQLNLGKLTATVPAPAHGFTVELPPADVVDLGTRFGASVSADGNCETHVFEGQVLVRSRASNNERRERTLLAGTAMKILADGGNFQELAAAPELFVHAKSWTDETSITDTASSERPAGRELVLWLDAARKIQLDRAGRVVSWGDLASDRTAAEDNAWQSDAKRRPNWIAKAAAGRPAVRFENGTFLQTTPFESQDDVTVFCVFQSRRGISKVDSIGSLVGFSGPSGLMLGTTADRRLLAGMLASDNGGGPSAQTSRLTYPLPANDELNVAAYVYNHSANRSWLYFNGKVVGESKATSTAAVWSPKLIGALSASRESFNGDVSEILVFNSVLSPEQCSETSGNLMKKYGIAESEKEPRVLLRLLPNE